MTEYRSIEDMLNDYYNPLLLKNMDYNETKKALTSSTTGIFQTIYGPKAYVQLNQETAFGILPKFTSKNKGYRAITARPSALQGGTAEGGNVASASDDTRTTVIVGDKIQQITYQYSEVLALREGKDDVESLDDVRTRYMTYHIEGIDTSLNTDGDTLAGNNFESIDRVTASAALATAKGWTSGDEDIYGIDRSANSWADAQVSYSASNRDLTLSLIRGVLYNCKEAGGRTNVILTGWDTYEALIDLLQTQQRFTEKIISVGTNGIEPGVAGESAISVLSFDGIPVYPNARTIKETGGISRMYFLDTTDPEGSGIPRLGFRLLRPPMAIESADFLKNGAFAIKGNYSTVGELYCRYLKGQGSLRDLK